MYFGVSGNHKKCIYIGLTGPHGSRPLSHFEKFWFSSVKRVTIFAVKGKVIFQN